MSNASMERTLSTLQISIYLISLACIKYVPFGNSGNISSASMEQFQKKQD